jgi:hypothetical protein
MTERRYQVFVSSTYQDLIEERQKLMQALLELDCIPAGMELFPAASDDQWTLIKRVIDDSDYYVLVVAGRYGSVAPDGMSYTEKEYRYALEKNKPTIAFVHKDIGCLPSAKVDVEPKLGKLKAFTDLAKTKLIRYWDTADELGGLVSRSVFHLMQSHPSGGWVRGNPQRQALARPPQYTITLAPPKDMQGLDVSRLAWERDKCFALCAGKEFKVRPVLGAMGASFEVRLAGEIFDVINDVEPVELQLVDRKGNRWETSPFFVYQQSVALSYIEEKEKIIASYGGGR